MEFRGLNGTYDPEIMAVILYNIDNIKKSDDMYNDVFKHELIHFIQDFIYPTSIEFSILDLKLFLKLERGISGEKILYEYKKQRESMTSYLYEMKKQKNWHDFKLEDDLIYLKENKNYFIELKEDEIYYKFNIINFLEYITSKIQGSAHPDIPYNIIDKLIDVKLREVFGELDTSCRLLIVEYCLMYKNPMDKFMLEFIENREFWKNICLSKINYDSLECILSENLDEKKKKDNMSHLEELFKYLLKIYNDCPKICEWLEVLKEYLSEKVINKFFFSEIYHLKKEDFFDEYMTKIGVPIIIYKFDKNKKNQNDKCDLGIAKKYLDNEFYKIYLLRIFMKNKIDYFVFHKEDKINEIDEIKMITKNIDYKKSFQENVKQMFTNLQNIFDLNLIVKK